MDQACEGSSITNYSAARMAASSAVVDDVKCVVLNFMVIDFAGINTAPAELAEETEPSV